MSLVKSRQFQRCVHFISHGTALGLNKTFQGRRRSIRPSPRGNLPDSLPIFLDAHFRLLQASGDSIVDHLETALFKAEEEVVQLRDQVFQLQTQANKLFESNFSQGMLSYDISIRCSWTWLVSESRDVSDIRGYLANTPRSAQAALNNVQEVSSSFGGFCFQIKSITN